MGRLGLLGGRRRQRARARPVSVKVDTYGTGDDGAAADFVSRFKFRPAAIIERFNLKRPIYLVAMSGVRSIL